MIKTILKYRNLDVTRDINDRLADLILPGFINGGDVIPVSGQLKVDLEPFKLISVDGMVVEETSDSYRLSTPAGQVTVIAVKAIYYSNAAPDIEVVAVEETAFNALINIDKYVIAAKINVPSVATNVLPTYIEFSDRQTVDPLGRGLIRGKLSSIGLLPSSKDNQLADIYIVADGINTPSFYAWDGIQWINITDSATIASNLEAHRQNLFANEKHLTDDQELAVTGSSGNPVGLTNKLVDEADPRLPTLDENAALAGSHGYPSASNKYVTQDFFLAIPSEQYYATAPITSYITAPSGSGPYYVGTAGVGSANKYFSVYHPTDQREYSNTSGDVVDIENVYTDAALTSILNPSLDPNVVNGYYINNPLYLKITNTIDTAYRVLYGKYDTLLTLDSGALLLRAPADAQTSTDAIKAIQDIKGRTFDDQPPVKEQNINLRSDLLATKQFLTAMLNTDYVIWDYDKLKDVPDYNSSFQKNIGVPVDWVLQNTGLSSFVYDDTTGEITYAVPPGLGVVSVGNIFRDMGGNEYYITGTDSVSVVTLRNRDGSLPQDVVGGSPSSAEQGAIKLDDNPRGINISDLKVYFRQDRVMVREVTPLLNEFHPFTGNVANQIKNPVHSPYYGENRIRLYGGWSNIGSGKSVYTVCKGESSILITGFFTDLFIFADTNTQSPTVDVYVDNFDTAVSTVDLSAGGFAAGLGTSLDQQQSKVEIISGLDASYPHTVELVINNAVGDMILYGFEINTNPATSYSVLPGKAFAQTDLYSNNAIMPVAASPVSGGRRGGVETLYIDRGTTSTPPAFTFDYYQMLDYDGLTDAPTGTAVSGSSTFTVSGGLTKFAYYKNGDVVKVYTVATGEEEIKYVSSIVGNIITFATPLTIGGVGAVARIIHVGSTQGPMVDPLREYRRYYFKDLGVGQDTDFSYITNYPSDRVYTTECGYITIAGYQVQYTTTGIDGIDLALVFPNASSTLTIRALCSELAIMVVNETATSIEYSVDGASFVSTAISGSGLRLVRILRNARFQTHEVRIRNATGAALGGFICFEPKSNLNISGTLLSTKLTLARHILSQTDAGDIITTGACLVDPYVYGGRFINASNPDWAIAYDYVNNAVGRYYAANIQGSYVEYSFYGSAIEFDYLAKSNNGVAAVYIDNLIANTTNFPAANRYGVDANGRCDMYAASATRRKAGIRSLAYGKHTIKLVAPQHTNLPIYKNPASTDYIVTLVSVIELNDDGNFAVSPYKGYKADDFDMGINSVRDERNFNSGAVYELTDTVVRSVTQPTKSGRVAVGTGTDSVNIVFSDPFPNSNYTVICSWINSVDVSPLFQPIVIKNITPNGFTATWNMPLDSNNYIINYVAMLDL